MPKISVIVPVYKVEEYLPRCVDSLLNQTFADLEVILVDDGSPDGCPAICDEYAKKDSRVVALHRQNGGLSAARNTGIDWVFAGSDSEWLAFVDSDDWVHPDFLKYMYDAALENGASMGACRILIQNALDKFQKIPMKAVVMSASDYYVKCSNTVSVCNKIFKKDLFASIRFPVGKLHEDAFVSHKLLWNAKKIAYLDLDMYFYFVRNESIMHARYSLRRLDELEALKEQELFFRSRSPEAAQKAVENYIYVLSNQIMLSGRMEQYKELTKKLRRDLRQKLRCYHNALDLKRSTHSWLYEMAYPKQMKVYWTVKAQKEKLLRKNRGK